MMKATPSSAATNPRRLLYGIMFICSVLNRVILGRSCVQAWFVSFAKEASFLPMIRLELEGSAGFTPFCATSTRFQPETKYYGGNIEWFAPLHILSGHGSLVQSLPKALIKVE